MRELNCIEAESVSGGVPNLSGFDIWYGIGFGWAVFSNFAEGLGNSMVP